MRKIFLLILFLVNTPFGVAQDHYITDQEIGQLIIIGFDGDSAESPGAQELFYLLKEERISGAVLFKRNIGEQSKLKHLIATIKQFSPKAFIAVDQEGGRVQRLRYHQYPSAQQVANQFTSMTEVKNKVFLPLAQELDSYGINLNFAPSLDVNGEVKNSVIGGLERAYSNNPEVVTHFARAFIAAHNEAGVLCCGKHYPGHGPNGKTVRLSSLRLDIKKGEIDDSHDEVVDITDTWDEQKDLYPYKKLGNDLKMVMTSHIINRKLDPHNPATFSKSILAKLDPSVIVFSDDCHMGALLKNYTLEQIVLKAFYAGVDVLVFSNNPAAAKNVPDFRVDMDLPYKVVRIVREEISRNPQFSKLIKDKIKKVTELKQKAFKG